MMLTDMKKLNLLCLLVLSVSIGSLRAQNLNSAYFLEGYTYGHQLNPAKDYERQGFVSMPFILGNANISTMGNVSGKNFLFPLANGKVATFLHPDISVQQALGDLKDFERSNTDLRYDIIGVGFHSNKGKGYNFLNLGVRANMSFKLPYGIFEVMKDLQNKDYVIGDMGVSEQSWIELSGGHSHQISKGWRVGGTLKVLLGAAQARVNATNLRMQLQGADKWTVTGNMNAEVGVKGFTWGAPETEVCHDGTTYERIKADNIDVDKVGLNGFGLALDLGAELDLEKEGLLKGMKISASLLDLGFIKWNTSPRRTTSAPRGNSAVSRTSRSRTATARPSTTRPNASVTTSANSTTSRTAVRSARPACSAPRSTSASNTSFRPTTNLSSACFPRRASKVATRGTRNV